ncbi:metal ABC transporter substrate-binding protein [Thermodesulfobacteriota bacterium]
MSNRPRIGIFARPAVPIVTALSALLLSLTFAAGAVEGSGKLSVYVVNYPLKYFAERIAGDRAKVVFPCPADEDPAFWVPGIQTIMGYQSADLILLNGAKYTKWVDKVSLPRARVVDTSAELGGRLIKLKGTVTHTHGPEGKHAHEGIAFTTWLDLDLASKQAAAVFKSLLRKRPEHRTLFRTNHAGLDKNLEALDRDVQAVVSKDPSRPLLASHPVYQYFAKRYGLNIRSLHWEPHQVPGEQQWQELREVLKHHPAKWMIWEGQPIKETVDKLQSLGIESLVFDPCGNVPDKGDFLTVMRENVRNLKAAFE